MPSRTTTPETSDNAPQANLFALRERLDELDDKVHDLLMERAKVIESVARSGKAAAYRPGREAAILRRLLARHMGNLPPQTLVRMWRELLAGTTAMQAAVTVAVFDPTVDGALTAIAREHFGVLTPTIVHRSAEAALRAVRDGWAAVAVLPFPSGPEAWWPALTAGQRLHVVARLPYWASDRPEHVPTVDALVVAAAAPDASGRDRCLIESNGSVTEIEGLIADDDPRLPAGTIVLGGYAIPVAGGEKT